MSPIIFAEDILDIVFVRFVVGTAVQLWQGYLMHFPFLSFLGDRSQRDPGLIILIDSDST